MNPDLEPIYRAIELGLKPETQAVIILPIPCGGPLKQALRSDPKHIELKDGKWIERDDVPGYVEKLMQEMETAKKRHDELCKAILGLKPEDTAHNFDHPALLTIAANLRKKATAAGVPLDCADCGIWHGYQPPQACAVCGNKPPPPSVQPCPECWPSAGGRRNNTEADPCPNCGCPF